MSSYDRPPTGSARCGQTALQGAHRKTGRPPTCGRALNNLHACVHARRLSCVCAAPLRDSSQGQQPEHFSGTAGTAAPAGCVPGSRGAQATWAHAAGSQQGSKAGAGRTRGVPWPARQAAGVRVPGLAGRLRPSSLGGAELSTPGRRRPGWLWRAASPSGLHRECCHRLIAAAQSWQVSTCVHPGGGAPANPQRGLLIQL